MSISYAQIARATAANDEQSDFGRRSPQDIVRDLGVDPEALTKAAQQRGIRALSMLIHGDPDRLRIFDLRELSPTHISILATFAASFLDGFSACLRITGEDAREIGEVSAQAAYWRKRAIDLGADPEGYLKAFPNKP